MTHRYKGLSLDQFKRLAAELGRHYAGKPVAIGLIGNLGAGKTTFVKNFASQLGAKNITSPTFVVINTIKLTKQNLHHVDFYRLSSRSELAPLGINELLASKKDVVIIEWIDKFPELKKYCDLIISIDFAPHKQQRHVTLEKN